MKLYVARHGQTQWNVDNKVCGVTDVPLTDVGLEQACRLAEEAARYPIDVIIASPLLRARQTAETVAAALGLPVAVDERLHEQRYGIFEGKDRGDPAFLANTRQFVTRYPGGESMFDLAYRVYDLLHEIKVTYPDKNVLLVCHGGVFRVIHTYFYDMSNDAYFHHSAPNAELVAYEF